WSFGLWLTTSFTTSYDEETVTSFIQGMADRDIPLSVFHFDCFWMREFQWCDFTWDKRCFPDPAGMLKRLKERGLRICVWINPYIAQKSPLFDEAAERGYLLKKPDGSVWQTDMWQAGMGIVDFTNPEARKWFAEKLQALVDMGVDCFKTDFGERIPTDVVYCDGSDPQRMHNFYAYLYNKTVFEALKEKKGEGETVLFARSATAGSQKFPVHWGGDCLATYESMAASLRAGLSIGLCGFGFWSHDIGGFIGTPTPDLYKRWCAFGLLSSHSRLHGNDSYRVPWLFDEEAVEVLRFFTKLKCRLMPYFYSAACEAHDGTVDYYLPSGHWTNFITGQVVEGGRWLREKHGYLSLPLMVRPNSVIPVGAVDNRPDYDFPNGLTFQIFELRDGATATRTVPDLKGKPAITLEAYREGQKIEISVKGERTENWFVQLRNVAAVKSVENGSLKPDPQGVIVVPNKGVGRLVIELER
ncbi:alpha-D-xyloside xylohydrolase, partial [Candidatus Fervidibacteria bacterium JGI MDM2 SSWTFF-3-K9]